VVVEETANVAEAVVAAPRLVANILRTITTPGRHHRILQRSLATNTSIHFYRGPCPTTSLRSKRSASILCSRPMLESRTGAAVSNAKEFAPSGLPVEVGARE
jgi:hypothetical protein